MPVERGLFTGIKNKRGRKKMDFVDIKQLISDKYIFYAHKEEEKKETIEEHTKLTEMYFKKIVEKRKILKSVQYIEDKLFANLGQRGKQVLEKMFVNVVTFHDLGKCNPFFQKKKMGNALKKEEEGFYPLGSTHSMLSAVLYLDYFMNELQCMKGEVEKEDLKKLRHLLAINAFTISRHHSDLTKLEDFFNLFLVDKSGYECVDCLQNYEQNIFQYKLKKLEVKDKKDTVKGIKVFRESAKGISEKESILYYIYTRLIYSLLVASDYYATAHFSEGQQIVYLGEKEELADFVTVFKETKRYQEIQKYKNNGYQKPEKRWEHMDINELRTELYLDAEEERGKNREKGIYYLEAPTGSGKSNTAFGLSFQMIEEDEKDKIFYVYPFNTLVEQNQVTLKEIFQDQEKIMKKIAVINSVTPMKPDENRIENEEPGYYKKILLNHQFLNYPMVLTTSVSLFHLMFRERREDIMGFYQLSNSVIVLDEIQNYKNTIWGEIIRFLQVFSQMLNIKIIIMSATLPDFTYLLSENDKNARESICNLIFDRNKYFKHPKFCNRVSVNFNLLQEEKIEDALFWHVIKESKKKKRILMEFIKKSTAETFYRRLLEAKERKEVEGIIELMTGDSNRVERKSILAATKSQQAIKEGMILVATQVVEAGVDIDLDIGYKDTSILDSEEQFLGRINRSCLREGVVYFFNWDVVTSIYKNDVRTNYEYTIFKENIQKILFEKDFPSYYKLILPQLKQLKERCNEDNINEFFEKTVGGLDFPKIAKRMELIDEDQWSIPIFLAREVDLLDGRKLIGAQIWREYKKLLTDQKMEYAKKQVLLSKVKAKMDYFIYDVKRGSDISYYDKIGEMYFIENGNDYFENGKLCREKLEKRNGLFFD